MLHALFYVTYSEFRINTRRTHCQSFPPGKKGKLRRCGAGIRRHAAPRAKAARLRVSPLRRLTLQISPLEAARSTQRISPLRVHAANLATSPLDAARSTLRISPLGRLNSARLAELPLHAARSMLRLRISLLRRLTLCHLTLRILPFRRFTLQGPRSNLAASPVKRCEVHAANLATSPPEAAGWALRVWPLRRLPLRRLPLRRLTLRNSPLRHLTSLDAARSALRISPFQAATCTAQILPLCCLATKSSLRISPLHAARCPP